MRALARGLLVLLTVVACGQNKDSPPSVSAGSATTPQTGSAAAPVAPPPAADSAATEERDREEVAKMVVHDVGSKALGNQTIDPACVSVILMPAGDWTVAAARLKDCGDKTARSILWLYKRKQGKWNEDYVGQPPKCWKGVPPDIAVAVTKATKIPSC